MLIQYFIVNNMKTRYERKCDEKQAKEMSDEINIKPAFKPKDMYKTNSYSETARGKSR